MQGVSEPPINGEPKGKQPRPMEDGNWVCEDHTCSNVNYPRRLECNKCGKRRGPLGNAVVKAYLESTKLARRELPQPALMHQGVGGLERVNMARGGYDQAPSFASQYVTGDGGICGRRSTLRNCKLCDSYEGMKLHLLLDNNAATEGKRLAEQLVASFAASTDPIGDAGECLASAALWLQTMKSRLQTGEGGGIPSSSFGISGGTSGTLSGGTNPISGMVNTLGGFRSSTGGATNPLTPSLGPLTPSLGSSSSIGNLAMNSSCLPYTTSGMLGSYIPRGPSNLGHLTTCSRSILPRPNLRFDDYKDRPSDFLREFGDPAAVSATAMGGSQRPEYGVNGNWECEDCKNVNYPRRTNCFQCNKRRGQKGDEIVRKYVRSLMEDFGAIRA